MREGIRPFSKFHLLEIIQLPLLNYPFPLNLSLSPSLSHYRYQFLSHFEQSHIESKYMDTYHLLAGLDPSLSTAINSFTPNLLNGQAVCQMHMLKFSEAETMFLDILNRVNSSSHSDGGRKFRIVNDSCI